MDRNGNSAGTWGVIKDVPAAITAPALTAMQGQCISDEELAEENALLTPEERAKLDALVNTLATVPTCPKCGKHEVIIRVDAYANYALQGWDKDGEIVAEFGEPDSFDTFDDRVYMCTECGHESNFRNGSEFRPTSTDAPAQHAPLCASRVPFGECTCGFIEEDK
jgi:endogenous inhibitor of DNA gyrase (YacG/DUF329 family)